MTSGSGSWSFTEADARAISEALEGFLGTSGARSAVLVDRAGQLVATAGEPLQIDLTAFATLTAADFSANDQLARLMGETAFSSLVHQGEKDSMLLADVARRVILVALFDHRTTLGLVRLTAKDAVSALTRLFHDVFTRDASAPPRPGLLAGADDEIDRLFG